MWTPLLILHACSGSADDTGEAEPLPTCETPGPLDEILQLHHVQALATHNSYNLEPAAIFDESQRYSHSSLEVQLSEQGVRGFVLDLHLRKGVGFEVFHLPVVDEGTTCRRLEDCLSEAWEWSKQHPCHLPLVFWLEPKDDLDGLVDSLEDLSGHWDELEEAIQDGWPMGRILTPDDVRGDADTLSEGVQAHGFPTLGSLRGHAIFALLGDVGHRDEYVAESPSTEGLLIFPDASGPEEPWAGMLKINDAVENAEDIADWGNRGFVITSNVDNAGESDETNTSQLEGSLVAGAHFLATNFPAAVEGRSYVAAIPGGEPVGCNPVTAPSDCTPAAMEALEEP